MNVIEQAAILDQADEAEDLNNPSESGTFERELPKEGIALLRLQSYLEVGKFQPKNKTWKPSVDCIFTFELLHPNHMIKPEDKPAFPMTYTFHVPKSTTKGSRYIRLFNAMNWERQADGVTPVHKNFNTMIGNTAWRGNLHTVKKDKKEYRNLSDAEGTWDIGAPIFESDPVNSPGVYTDIPVPEMHQEGRLFFWENPAWNEAIILAAWESLYIEGEYDDGKSKNWIQDRITSPENLEWADSLTKQVIEAGGVLNTPAELVDEAASQQDPATQAPPEKNEAVEKTKAQTDADALAILGL